MTITPAELMNRVNDLVPVFVERAQKTEENRAPLDEMITDLIDSERFDDGIVVALTG